MNDINDDYLWDRSGEPDPEIQQLEEVLGALRYQPQPLEIPAGLAPVNKRAFSPRFLAIAATIAIMLLGVGLWLGLRRQPTAPVANVAPAQTTGGNESVGVAPAKSPSVPASIDKDDKQNRQRVNPGILHQQMARSRRPGTITPALTAQERKEAEAGKEQLMLALRVACSKLSFAQKKAQEINSDNLVHNQHKIG